MTKLTHREMTLAKAFRYGFSLPLSFTKAPGSVLLAEAVSVGEISMLRVWQRNRPRPIKRRHWGKP